MTVAKDVANLLVRVESASILLSSLDLKSAGRSVRASWVEDMASRILKTIIPGEKGLSTAKVARSRGAS